MAKSDIVLDDDVVDVLGRVRVQPNESGAGGIVSIFPGRGNMRVGGDGAEGDLVVQNGDGENRIHLDGGATNAGDSPAAVYANRFGLLQLGREEAEGAGDPNLNYSISEGDLVLKDYAGERRVSMTGGTSPAVEGLTEAALDVDVDVDSEPPPDRVIIDGGDAILELGGDGVGGDLVLRNPESDPEGGPWVRISSDPEEETRISVRDADGATTLTLSGDGRLEVGNTVIAGGVDLLERLQDLETRVGALEEGP